MLREVATSVQNADLLVRRRQQIAEAAYISFSKKGFKSTTVDEITTLVGIDKGTLYGYIERKEDLLYLVFRHYIPALQQRLAGAAAGIGDPRRRLEALIDEQIRIIDEYRDLVLLVYRELRHLDRDSVQSVFQLMRQINELYETAIQQGVAEGSFEVENSRIVVNALLSMLYMWAPNNWDLGRFGLEAVREQVKQLFFRGIEKRGV